MGRKICLIDYENTALAGLDGLENLEPSDGLRIICSNDNIGNTLLHILSIYRERNITIEVEYMNQRGSNALDFRLSCDLGYFIAQGDVEKIFVVSRDKGYLHAISEASALNSDVLIVWGESIRDCLFKVEHGMTQLPIEGFAEPCKESRDMDADMKLEWQNQNKNDNMHKTSKALGILKQRIPVLGKSENEEVSVKKTDKKNCKKNPPKEKTKQKSDKKMKNAQEPKQAVKKADKKAQATETKKVRNDEKQEKIKPVAAKTERKPKAVGEGKSREEVETLTNAQRKKLQQEVALYIGAHTTLEETYVAHVAAMVVKEHSVMEFRRAVKKVLGKKHMNHEAELVDVYMHFRKA